jgi:predicted DNA binding protein
MRYVTVRVTPTEGGSFHPLGGELAADPSITRGAIHRIELLADGTGVMLAEARGDQERYSEILANSEYVHDFAVTGADGWWYSYTHFEPTDLTRKMVERRGQSSVMMEMPIEVEPDGSFRFTFVGDTDALADSPVADDDAYEIELLEIGDRPPDANDLFACLTARQREILDAALDLGYYENPRAATHEDIARVVDATPSTVGEHLRKIESRVLSQFT